MTRRNRSSQPDISHKPRRQTLAIACCLALLTSVSVHAEEAAKADAAPDPQATDAGTNTDVETLDAVKVTGIRAAIASSVETKNESTSIVEAISAEDIGKLPDISIADSISRLPGLTTQRVDGRSQVIHIRGMSEQFAGTLLNGREQVTTGDNRGVEFDQYPAELINAVVVYKTPDASLVGQGLSGTVDMQTIRPLDLGERRIVFSGQGEYNSLGDLTDGGDDTGYRIAASYVDQFRDNTIGVALGVARLDSPFQEQHYKAWWWANTDLWGAPQGAKPADAIALQGAEGWIKSRELQRDGVMGVFEFKPNDAFHSILDVYYSKFDQDEITRGAMWTNDPWWNSGAASYSSVTTTTVDGVPVVNGGTLEGIQPVVRNDSNTREDKLYSIGWNNSFKLADTWTLDADLSYSRADRDQSQLETYAGALGGQSVDFSIPVGVGSGYGNYALPDLSDPSSIYLWDPQYWGHDGRLEDSTQKDTIKAARLNLNHVIDSSDFLRSYDVGVNFSKRTKEKSSQVYFADLKGGGAPTLVGLSDLLGSTSLGFAGMGNILTYDPRAILYSYYDVVLNESDDDLRKDFIVEEDIKTFYAKANIDLDLTDQVRLRGNVGVQYVRTDQSSTGFNATGGTIVGAQTLGTSYGDILPSLNLVADFGNGWMTRFGAAKEMMRPRINDLGAYSGAGVSTTTGTWSGSGGNPLLEPYRARSVDLSVEKYLGDSSYVALALFYKHLESYVYTQTIDNWDFSGYDDNGNTPISNYGTYSTPANGEGGYMRGAEFSTVLAGDLFHPALEGFGMLLNASYTESSIDPDGPGGSSTDTIPGLSKVVANATVYYEKSGFSARLSERYRGKYRGEYSSLFGQRSYRYTLSEKVLDMQLSYDFPESSRLNGLTLLLQVNNLNNEPFRTEVSDSNGLGLYFPEEYTEYGRQYLIGFRYSL